MEFQLKKRHPIISFGIGLYCAVIGIVIAWLLFPSNTGIVSVFFTSLAMLPFLKKLLPLDSITRNKKHPIKFKNPLYYLKKFLNFHKLTMEYKNIFIIYIMLFFGIFLVYTVFQMNLPGPMAESFFVEQTNILRGSAGEAVLGYADRPFMSASISLNTFIGIILNNLVVLMVAFVISIVYRAGIFIIAWNASVWGVIFGSALVESSKLLGQNMAFLFVLSILIIVPHMVAEAFAYICGVISGSSVYITLWRKLTEKQHAVIITDAIRLLILAGLFIILASLIEVYFAFPAIKLVLWAS
ncbi:MAG: hypothetical protein KKB03_01320 [Nanoarchaeota archaeon]|nr:hypothetical protein [Nanoarchaeota archaeon]MBU1135216.1 hypothetical protein [Nanoarchaeota archaeon]MBU2519867.1 hypothetical protein [Nanoarchaeota archaeon]